MSETELSKAIKLAIKRHFPEIRITRLQAGIITARHGAKIHCADPGWPDFIGFTADGRFVGIEIKTKTGKTSADQVDWLIDAAGCKCLVIQVSGVLDCINKLKGALNGKMER